MLIRSLVQAFARQMATIESRRSRPRKSAIRKSEVISAVEALESRSLLSASVLTYHNNSQSSGVNSAETLLTNAAVNVNTFQKESQTSVDGPVYAQPLYVSGLNLTGGTSPGVHNTAIVATENDSVYAIDTLSGKVLWNISLTDTSKAVQNPLGALFMSPIPGSDAQDNQFGGQIGITATPVIDSATNTLYVEAATKQYVFSSGFTTHYVQMLYKISLTTGTVTASTIIGDTISDLSSYTYRTVDTGTGTDPYVVGTGAGAITVGSQSRVYFNALREFDQSALALTNGHVIVSFTGHSTSGGAVDPAHGWVMMFNAANLGIQAAFNTTPNGGHGGVWQSGGAPVIDAQGNLYIQTSVGTFDSNNSVPMTGNGFQGNADYANSFLKLSLDPSSTQSNQNGNPNGWGLKLTDYFSPFNNAAINTPALTLGAGGITLLPDSVGSILHPHLMVGAGLGGTIYLIDRDNMGKFNSLVDSVVQTVAAGVNGSAGTPSFFNGQLYYFPGLGGAGKAYAFLNGQIGSSVQTPDVIGQGGGTTSISSNGNLDGVVWVVDRGSNQLKAYSAADLTTELWTSAQAPANRDRLGPTVNYSVPTVADGQVIVGTANQVVIYGPPVGTSTLSNIEATPLNYIENGITPISGTLQVSLTSGTYIDQATVQITGNYQVGQDTLVFPNTSQLTGTWNSATGTMTIKGLASAAAYQAALRTVSYHNLQDNPNTLNRTVTFQTGSTIPSNTVTRTLTITPVNDPPVISVESTTLDYIRLSTTPISPGLLISDPDNATLPSATVQITGNYLPEDRLIFKNTANIKGSWNAQTGTLTLTGVDTGSNYRTALRSVSYYDIQAVPNTAMRTVSFSTTDGSLPSNIATRNINVIRQNNAPTLSNIESTALAYTQDAPAVNVSNTILVADPDNTTLPSATIQITGNYQPTADRLTFVNTANIIGTWNSTTGTLTLTGSDTGTNYRAALRSVQFTSSSVVPGPQTRVITFQTTDGTALSNTVTRQINIQAVPTLSGIETTPLTYNVANAKVQVSASIQITLYDQGMVTGAAVHILNVQSGDLLSVTTIPGILASWDSVTGTLTFTGSSTIANYNTMLHAVKFSNSSQNPANLARQISFQVFEGALGSNVQSRNINISSGTNSPPVLSAIETTATTFKAKSAAINVTSTINVFDADNATLTGAVVTISKNFIIGQDFLQFVDTPTIKGVWTPATARLTLTGVDTVANYQKALRSITFINTAPVPSTVTRTVSFQVTDGFDPDNLDGNIVSRDIKVTL